jgi:hypothetical protein
MTNRQERQKIAPEVLEQSSATEAGIAKPDL